MLKKKLGGKMRNNSPKSMLNKLGTLTGTLNRKIPAREMGILFNDPTRLHKSTSILATGGTQIAALKIILNLTSLLHL